MKAPKHQAKPPVETRLPRFDHWAAMEPEWRAGVVGKKELSQKYGVSRAAIDKHFAQRGIERNYLPEIQGRADEIVAQKVAKAAIVRQPAAPKAPTFPVHTIEEVVEANANIQASVRIRHRQDIDAAKSLFYLLLDEVRDATSNRPLIDELVEVMDSEGAAADAERAATMRKTLDRVMSSQSRISSAKMLTEILEKIIRLEREAFGINVAVPEDSAPNSLAAFLAGMKRSALPIVMEVEHDDSL